MARNGRLPGAFGPAAHELCHKPNLPVAPGLARMNARVLHVVRYLRVWLRC